MPDKEKWDERYKDTSSDNGPASLLLDNAHLFAKGKALDVAMGLGNNAFFLAAQGYAVTGVDISSVAVTRVKERAEKNGLAIQALEADLAEFPVKDEILRSHSELLLFRQNPHPETEKRS